MVLVGLFFVFGDSGKLRKRFRHARAPKIGSLFFHKVTRFFLTYNIGREEKNFSFYLK